MRRLNRFLADCRGVSVVEFALVAPVLIMLLIGAMKMGMYFFAQNSVNNALDEAARSAAVYPTPSDSALQTTFSNHLLKEETGISVTLSVTHGTSASGLKYVDLATRYSVPVEIAFVEMGSIPVSSGRRVYTSQ